MNDPQTFNWREMYSSVDEPRKELQRFGDQLAKRMEYKRLRGIDAIMFFLIQEHHWLPADVGHITLGDLCLLLREEEEAAGWLLPEDWEDERWNDLFDVPPKRS